MQRYVLMRVAPSSLRRLVIFAEKKSHRPEGDAKQLEERYRPVSQRMLVGQDYFLHVGAVIVIDIVARV